MRSGEVEVQTVNASTARQRWSQLVKQVYRRENRVIVEKSGIPVAALISVDDFEQLQRYEAARRERFKALDETWEAFADVPPEELEREVHKAVTEVRAAMRQQTDHAAGTS